MLSTFVHGRLATDVALRDTQSGKKVANVRVACDRRDRNADPVDITLVLWEGAAENAAKHLVKGQQVTFSGRLEPRTYTAANGEDRTDILRSRGAVAGEGKVQAPGVTLRPHPAVGARPATVGAGRRRSGRRR